jgi:FMN phosphatase YigB (HAD superfamily)
MKIVFLPSIINGLLFDVDLTLYSNKDYYESQKQLLVNELALESGLPYEEALLEINRFRDEYALDHGGRKPALGKIFLNYGISVEKSCEWRTKLFKPEDYLCHDSKLVETMEVLQSKYAIAAVTNNTTEIVNRTLSILGVKKYFSVVIGLDRSLSVKPSMIPFEMAAKDLDIPVSELVSIGDRLEIDIELPVKNGMGGILVENMEEVYSLPSLL